MREADYDAYDLDDPKMTRHQLRWFLQKIEVTTEHCWRYRGRLSQYGYAKIRDRGGHVIAYEHFMGPVPEGLQLDHLCRNRACVNPWHLEPVTVGENIRRGHAARGTLGGRYGERKREAQRRYAARKREAAA